MAADLVMTDVAYLWIGDSRDGDKEVVLSQKPSFESLFVVSFGCLFWLVFSHMSSWAMKPSWLSVVGAWDYFSTRKFLTLFDSNFSYLFSTIELLRGDIRTLNNVFVVSSIFWLLRRYLFSFDSWRVIFSMTFSWRFDILAVLFVEQAFIGVCLPDR